MARSLAEGRWIVARMADELLGRLDLVQRSFSCCLLIGGEPATLALELRARDMAVAMADPGFRFAREMTGVQCDEDRLPFADASFDLVIAIGTLDTVTDLPGALVLIRRCLRPDGLFLAAMAGAGSLPALRKALPSGEGTARFHPQIDVRAAGDLLGRAGFALPVADADTIDVRYSSLSRLTRDLRANGLRNVLARRHPLRRHELALAESSFRQAGDGQKTAERLNVLYLTGWAPPAKASAPADR